MGVRVVIVDRDPCLRDRISALLRLQRGMQIVGETAEVADVPKLCRRVDADVIILGADESDMVSQIVNDRGALAVVVLSTRTDARSTTQLLEAGALACLPRTFEKSELLSCLSKVRLNTVAQVPKARSPGERPLGGGVAPTKRVSGTAVPGTGPVGQSNVGDRWPPGTFTNS